MKNYSKIIVFTIATFILANDCFLQADGCAPQSCDKNQKYPMNVCNGVSNGEAKTKVECLTAEEINILKEDNRIYSPPLPICLEFDNASFPGNVNLINATTVVFDLASANADLQKATDRWNCICNQSGDCQCKIKVYFTGRRCEFYTLESSALATADIMYLTGQNPTAPCYSSCENTFIYVNNSNAFMYGNANPPNNAIPNTFFVTDQYAGNIGTVNSNGGEVYSFAEVIMHEIGHIMGFAHYDAAECGNAKDYSKIMNAVGKPSTGGTSKELSDFEKCAFQGLYCLGIYEYQPQGQKIYPNPGERVVTIDFELPKYTENLKITIQDVLGQTRLIPIENGNYEAGEQSILINVDALPVGVYYVIIEAGAYKTAQPLTIVR